MAGGLSASMTGLSRLSGGVSGMLWVHLLAGRGLRPAPSGSSPGSPPSGPLAPAQPPVAPRDLYCVLECDRVHKARTVVSYQLMCLCITSPPSFLTLSSIGK